MRGLKSAERVGLVQVKMSSDVAAVIWQVHRIDWCKLVGGRRESLEKLTPEKLARVSHFQSR